jgi:hypothetical protein
MPPDPVRVEVKVCTRCEEVLPLPEFYFVSKKLGTRRGQCKGCMREIKESQRDPNWRPTCSKCGKERERTGMGRRLCQECFDKNYEYADERVNGSHRLKLKPCSACGIERKREGNLAGGSLCHTCRSVPQSRRQSLKSLFNMNPREYLALLEFQGGRCAICKKKPRKSLAVDHRHGLKPSRIIRGLLCSRCNLLISQANDSPELLRWAADFLENPTAQQMFPGREANPEADRSNHRTWKRR